MLDDTDCGLEECRREGFAGDPNDSYQPYNAVYLGADGRKVPKSVTGTAAEGSRAITTPFGSVLLLLVLQCVRK